MGVLDGREFNPPPRGELRNPIRGANNGLDRKFQKDVHEENSVNAAKRTKQQRHVNKTSGSPYQVFRRKLRRDMF